MNYDAKNPTHIARLLEGQKQNGLVNIAVLEDPDAMFRMYERVNVRNKPTVYSEALNGTLEWNLLAQAYFSAENIQTIQDRLRQNIYRMSGNQIKLPNQNIDTLKIVMREFYLEYAVHCPKDVKKQVDHLNTLVLEHLTPKLYSEAVGYFQYLVSQSTLAMPMDRPLPSDRVYKQLDPHPFVEWRK